MLGYFGLFVWTLTSMGAYGSPKEYNWVQLSSFMSEKHCVEAMEKLKLTTDKAICIKGLSK